MPIREYHCTQCQEDFEELVSGDTLPPCAACGSIKVKPLMSRCCAHSAGSDFSSGSGSSCSSCSGGHCSSCR